MTIADAIRRAKQLGQARLQNEAAAESPRHRSEPPPQADSDRGSAWAMPEPAIALAPLAQVMISDAACEKNQILVSEKQLREYPAADAAYRLLRSRLQNRLKQNNWFSVAIASPSQDDGKTITALNLAASIAREKQRPVYVIDLDMRNPSICRFLGITDIRPLPDFLTGQAKAEDVLAQTSHSNLIVAGALAPAENASELLAGPGIAQLIAHIRLRSPNSVVLLDCPPTNVTDEALLIGPRVDAFLMVVSEGRTERKNLSAALGALSEFTVAGIVLNRSSDSHVTAYGNYQA
jgi:capsular exopolysaccharide synthesis family protein